MRVSWIPNLIFSLNNSTANTEVTLTPTVKREHSDDEATPSHKKTKTELLLDDIM